MNVLMITSWYSEMGEPITSGIFHFEQAKALQDKCNVAIYFPYSKKMSNNFSDMNENGIRTFRTKNEGTGTVAHKIRMFFRCVVAYIKIRRRFHPDLLHVQVAGQAGQIALIWNKIFKIPYIVTEHCPIELMRLDRKYNLIHSVYANSKKNICVSPKLREQLGQKFPDIIFDVVYNGTLSPQKFCLSSSLNYRKYGINCAIVASFYDKEIKGFQYLLPAISILQNDMKLSLTLHICGGGEYLDYYKAMARELEIEEVCVFYGQCSKEKVYQIINQMDFCVSASIFESAGVFAQECMLLGKPMVVTRSGGVDSIVSKDSAIVVDARSTDALKNGIEEMIHHFNDFKMDKTVEDAVLNFEIENVSQKYVRIYCEVLKD